MKRVRYLDQKFFTSQEELASFTESVEAANEKLNEVARVVFAQALTVLINHIDTILLPRIDIFIGAIEEIRTFYKNNPQLLAHRKRLQELYYEALGQNGKDRPLTEILEEIKKKVEAENAGI